MSSTRSLTRTRTRTTVTGGAGFIGSHLIEHLLAEGDDVIAFDDMSTGSRANLDDALLLSESDSTGSLTIVEGSILDKPALDAVIAGADRVFHLAAAVGVRLIVDEPLAGLRTNIHGTENVLDACLAHDVALLVTSTSEVYGKNTSDSLSEDADRILGSSSMSRWTYAAAKSIDEAFANGYVTEFGLRVAIVRLFNTVGPRQTGRYGMVVPQLVGQALRGEPLTVFGSGTQTRCFSSVRDIAPAIARIQEHPGTVGLAVNLGGGHEISILDLAHRIIELTGSTSEVQLVPYCEAYPAGFEDMERRVPNNSLAGSLIGFEPLTSIDEIILSVMDHLGARAPVPSL
ncbi:NAD(P)-dependent oxidoreductase [Salinibacterium sp. NK8237]|uniref:NAD-dependent epimerase/dehydratase family protein n=1 Tax=Salinibacterium sp. NK8237 TaxID=2792038 RepID=UPI0018CDF173|nr:NAD-dependent epimerase/dehydratase family protein [Salinibacterium sp. NK8237]MBH0131071.1 NAD-dependent epimerase/dehydratase family protein [Salinibacterium sp. NK8237]